MDPLGNSEPTLEGAALPAGCPGRAAPRDDGRHSLALVGVLARLASNPIFTQRGLSCSRPSPLAFPPRTDTLGERAMGSRWAGGDSVSLGRERPTAFTPMTLAGGSEQRSCQQSCLWSALESAAPGHPQKAAGACARLAASSKELMSQRKRI